MQRGMNDFSPRSDITGSLSFSLQLSSEERVKSRRDTSFFPVIIPSDATSGLFSELTVSKVIATPYYTFLSNYYVPAI